MRSRAGPHNRLQSFAQEIRCRVRRHHARAARLEWRRQPGIRRASDRPPRPLFVGCAVLSFFVVAKHAAPLPAGSFRYTMLARLWIRLAELAFASLLTLAVFFSW